ncbi:threonine dehydratase [Klenkia marina]|uniref:Threonine dehydratase n=1 Tax=Klenkia marina TaxID=1960309 RepID=A0A1G4XR58_9ACTN|nr:serine/threonine dehydratase [Klenkia marina]SCX43691.1 threonine dehydratase [Klenkia marina]
MPLTTDDVAAAAARTAGVVRPVTLLPADRPHHWFAAEFLQHTGTFKARGAANLVAQHVDAGTMPEAGVVIASGGNAGLACAWAAARHGVPATVFVPGTAPAVKVDLLRDLGARVVQVGTEYAHAADAATDHVAASGALASHAYDHPLVAAGAGTLFAEVLEAARGAVDTVVVAVGGGGLLAGVATVAASAGVRVVAVEPVGSQAFAAALAAGRPVDVPVRSVAADALDARRVTPLALAAAAQADVVPVLVEDDAIVAARRQLWSGHRVAVEHAAAAAHAALVTGGYRPADGERVVTVLCGANTDPATLATPAP